MEVEAAYSVPAARGYIYIEESGVRGGEAELLMIAIEE